MVMIAVTIVVTICSYDRNHVFVVTIAVTIAVTIVTAGKICGYDFLRLRS